MPRRLLSQLTEVIPRLTWHQQQQVLRPAWWWAARTPAEQEGPPLLRRSQARREAPWLQHLAACPPACSVPPSCRHDRSLTPTRRCLPPTVWLDLGLGRALLVAIKIIVFLELGLLGDGPMEWTLLFLPAFFSLFPASLKWGPGRQEADSAFASPLICALSIAWSLVRSVSSHLTITNFTN